MINLPKKSPLYWSAYEYLFLQEKKGQNAYMPESAWLDNINWVSTNLSTHGFDMICIDGWGDDFSYS